MSKKAVLIVVNLIFITLALILMFIFEYCIRVYLNIPYSKTLYVLGIFILISYLLGVINVIILRMIEKKVNQKKNRE